MIYHKIQITIKQDSYTKANESGEEAQKETMKLIDIKYVVVSRILIVPQAATSASIAEIERPTTLVNCPPPSGNINPHYTVPPSSSKPSSSAPSSTSDRLSPSYTYPSLAFTIRYGCASYTDNLVSSTDANNGSSTTSYDSSPFSSYSGVEAIFLVGNASPGSSEAVV